MKKLKLVCVAIAMACATPTLAGGLLTNTNQHVAFNRMMSREASIGIDGVYYNPAGVVFMSEGHHLAINWQLAFQTRTINNDYALFTNNVNAISRVRLLLLLSLLSSMPTTRANGLSRQASPSPVVAVSVPSTMDWVLSRKSYQRLLLLLADWQVSLTRLWAIHSVSQVWKCSPQTRLSAKQASTASTAICTVASITMVSL